MNMNILIGAVGAAVVTGGLVYWFKKKRSQLDEAFKKVITADIANYYSKHAFSLDAVELQNQIYRMIENGSNSSDLEKISRIELKFEKLSPYHCKMTTFVLVDDGGEEPKVGIVERDNIPWETLPHAFKSEFITQGKTEYSRVMYEKIGGESPGNEGS